MAGLLWVVAIFEILAALLLWTPGWAKHWAVQDKIAAGALVLNIFTLVALLVGAVVAFNALTQTKRQADIAKDTEKAQLRAYVISNAVQFISYSQPAEIGRSWSASALIENTGETPTRNLRQYTRIALGGDPEQLIAWKDKTLQFVRNLIGPKSSGTGGIFTTDDMQQMRDKQLISIAGIVKYEDVFGEPHLTEFCYKPRVPRIDFQHFPVGQPIRAFSVVCEHHNCADDECGPDWRERAKE
ncbi:MULTISPECIES: hypothetical protein [unclassified Bradyrhizobium]|uniref:hypothetical protein n=1 Tax=unclassified Bradyrhizobium TaxID=2631580 RepID=UPI002915DFB0|nr:MULTISPECIES: hypothetical protein [unclassified Bradyrhizobium]